MEKWQTGLVPRLYTKFLRKWATRLSLIAQKELQKYPSIIFINQIRKKMNVPPYMNPEIMPGGDAQYFFASDIIRVSKKGVEMSSDKKDPMPLYQTVKLVVEKSKVSAAKLEGTFDVPIHKYVDASGRTWGVGEVDNDKTIMEYARKFDVLKESPLTTRGKTYSKLDEVEKDLKGNVALRWALFKVVNEAYSHYVPSLAAGDRNAEETQE
jgi:RecA/RadA recombinase